MSQQLNKKVGIASAIMMGSVFLSRLMGLPRDGAIAYIGGASGQVDAYQLAFLIPEILNHILASGFLSVTFIPIFSAYLAQNREDEGWRVFSVILTCFGSLLLLFITICFVFTPEIVDIIAPGRSDSGDQTGIVKMTRILMPAQLFFFSGGLFFGELLGGAPGFGTVFGGLVSFFSNLQNIRPPGYLHRFRGHAPQQVPACRGF